MVKHRYKYCMICRGEDDLMRCKECSRAFHCECVNLREVVDSYVCEECSGDATEFVTATKGSATNNLVGRWHTKLLAARTNYLKAIEHLTLPFNDAISSKRKNKTAKSKSKAKVTTKASVIPTRVLQETPSYLSNVTMRDYQLVGTSRLISWFGRGAGGILADEMGLGKTLQTIALLSYLKEELGLSGPHLVVTPLAVLQNWANEFTRFAPQLTYKKIHGSAAERDQLMCDPDVLACKFEVYLTTYETLVGEEGFFTDSWRWATITIDEGHRIKNENAALRRALNRLKCPFRLLLTGTPLQNNMHELWALLNYLLPEIFQDSSLFDTAADISDDTLNRDTCEKARALLDECFMIRREKKDVETSLPPKIFCKLFVHMTPLQRKWYRSILSINDPCNLDTSVRGDVSLLSNTQLQHILSQLQKVVNHPKQILIKRESDRHAENSRVMNAAYSGSEFIKPRADLIAPDRNSPAWAAEEELRSLRGERLVKSSGKLAVLDRLLRRLQKQGSRVLLFSQFTETLDVLEEYVTFRFGAKNQVFLRLDGQVNRVVRELDVRKFNAPESKIFIYLISTKAGGQGINLATANSVVLYDTAWNPQVDLQAQDRAHRIGQKGQVTVYRLLTADSFEERVMEVAERKLLLDHFVVARGSKTTAQTSDGVDSKVTYLSDDRSVRRLKRASSGGKGKDAENMKLSMSETWAVLRHGTEKIFKTGPGQRTSAMTDAELDAFLDSSLTDSGGKTLPTVGKAVQYGVDFGGSGSESISSDAGAVNMDSSAGEMSGLRTIFDLEDNTTAASAATGDEEEVALSDDEEEATAPTVAPALPIPAAIPPAPAGPISAVTTSAEGNGSIPPVTPFSASQMAPAAPTGEPQAQTDDFPAEWAEEERRFPKRQRIAARRFVPVTTLASDKPKRKKRVHESECFCCDDGGDLIECGICPKVYHCECVGLSRVPKGSWKCHWHSCYTCLRSASNSGGVQFRCVDCPLAYCFDCFPKDIELKTIEPPREFVARYEKSGFQISPNSLFFRCNECTTEMEEKAALLEKRKKRQQKYDTVRAQVSRDYQSRIVLLKRRLMEYKKYQEAQSVEILRQRREVIPFLQHRVEPSVAATFSAMEQQQNREALDNATRNLYVAEENMQKVQQATVAAQDQIQAASREFHQSIMRLQEGFRVACEEDEKPLEASSDPSPEKKETDSSVVGADGGGGN